MCLIPWPEKPPSRLSLAKWKTFEPGEIFEIFPAKRGKFFYSFEMPGENFQMNRHLFSTFKNDKWNFVQATENIISNWKYHKIRTNWRKMVTKFFILYLVILRHLPYFLHNWTAELVMIFYCFLPNEIKVKVAGNLDHTKHKLAFWDVLLIVYCSVLSFKTIGVIWKMK